MSFRSGLQNAREELTLRDTVLVMDDSTEACPARVEDSGAGLEDVEYECAEEEDGEWAKATWFLVDVALERTVSQSQEL